MYFRYLSCNLRLAERARVGGPPAEADGDHVGDDAADIDLLRGVVVRSGVIARDGHRPGLVPGMQAGQEAGRVVDVAARVEHLADAAEGRAVVAVIDLHAAEIDQCLAVATRGLEVRKGFGPRFREDGFSFYIQGVGLQAALVAGLRQANRVEDSGGDAVAVRGTQDLRFARVRGGSGGVGRKDSETR